MHLELRQQWLCKEQCAVGQWLDERMAHDRQQLVDFPSYFIFQAFRVVEQHFVIV